MFTELIHIERSSPPRFTVPRSWLFVCVMISLCVSQREAMASCGDYLFRHGKPVAFHSLDGMSDPRSGIVSPDAPYASSAQRSTPCHGPHCSRSTRPFAPVKTPLSIRTGDFDQAMLSGRHAFRPLELSMRVAPVSERGVSFEPNPFFRPPDLR